MLNEKRKEGLVFIPLSSLPEGVLGETYNLQGSLGGLHNLWENLLLNKPNDLFSLFRNFCPTSLASDMRMKLGEKYSVEGKICKGARVNFPKLGTESFFKIDSVHTPFLKRI